MRPAGWGPRFAPGFSLLAFIAWRLGSVGSQHRLLMLPLSTTNASGQGYLRIPPSELGSGQPVQVRIVGDQMALAQDLAQAILQQIREGQHSPNGTTLILPVGPVDHYPILARWINEQKVSCRHAVFILMDEYLDD